MTSKTKKLFTICASSLIIAGFAADVTLHTNPTTAQASSSLPAKYQHTWYGKIGESELIKYVIGKRYAYFYGDINSNEYIKYKYEKSKDGWYKTFPFGVYEATPFKPSGNYILIGYDTQIIKLHR